MNGKGSGRRAGADDAAYKASPAIPESPRFRTPITQEPDAPRQDRQTAEAPEGPADQ